MATLKGTAVQPNFDWIRREYGPHVWEQILDGLPPEDREIVADVQGPINYELALISRVLESLAATQFPDDRVAAETAFRSMGAYIAEVSLTGLYSLFIRVAKPEAILKRIPMVVTTMFNGVTAETVTSGDRTATVIVRGAGELAYAGPRLCGWAEKALEMCGADSTVTEEAWERGEIRSDELIFNARW